MARIGWFVPFHRTLRNYDRVLASVWIRCLELIRPLRELGYGSVVNRPWAPMDIAVFLRVQGVWAQRLQRYLQWRGVRTVFDVVVNYYEPSVVTEGSSQVVSRRQVADCIRMSQAADAVIAASEYIRSRAERYNPSAYYVPDTVTRAHFRLSKPESDFGRTPLTLIWAGHAHKASFIDRVWGAFDGLPVRLRIIAERPPDIKAPYDFVRWRYETFPKEIIKGDVCISPRATDNPYDRGHSNFKIMVFLAQGVPALVSPQDSYLEVIRDGYNGFVCRSLGEWRERVQRLLADRALLSRMSRNAIESSKPYLTENVASRYDAIFRSLLADQPRGTAR